MQNLRRKLRGTKGYSLAEALLAVLLIAMLSTGVAAGVAFGARQYNDAMSRSEASVLCSTLTSIFRTEFSSTSRIETGSGGKVLRYVSTAYSFDNADPEDPLRTLIVTGADRDGFGQLALQAPKTGGGAVEIPLLSSAAYSKNQKLTVKLNSITYSGGVFQVDFTVRTANAGDVETSFNVIPLNKVTTVP